MYVAVILDTILDFKTTSYPNSSEVVTHQRLYMAAILNAILDFDFLRIGVLNTYQKSNPCPRKPYVIHQNHICISNCSAVITQYSPWRLFWSPSWILKKPSQYTQYNRRILNLDGIDYKHKKWMLPNNAGFRFRATGIRRFIDPYAGEFFRTIFNSFEAGIANAISSSIWRKIIIFMQKYTCTSSKYSYLIY